jgi:asparagine synthase (glutamine-hydrolysing)
MCGVGGIFDPAGVTGPEDLRAAVTRMSETLRHRGPDDDGVWVDAERGVGLGSRRLAIVDLSEHGRQPMASASGRYVIVFNGEIYNHRDLRRRLEGLGHGFRGHSDTEVFLGAISQWGLRRALDLSNGMFAFALWDREIQVLHLVRDRLGEKPLYYGWVGGRFACASELKALRMLEGFGLDVDREALALFLRYKYVPTPWSIYEGIRKLPPGTILTISRDDPNPEPVPYWSLQDVAEAGLADPFPGSERDAEEELHDLLGGAIQLRMEADVPLGAFLSGGVDSSTVVALMQQNGRRPARTFTIGFREASFNEAEHARAVAAHLGTDHTELYVEPADARAVIPRLPILYDEPFADSSQIPTYLVSQLARREVTVALSGDGGDELFGGYNRHLWGANVSRWLEGVPAGARRMVGRALASISPRRWDSWFRAIDPFLAGKLRQRTPGDKIHKLARALSAQDARELYASLVSHWSDDPSMVIGAPNRNGPAVAGLAEGNGLPAQMMFNDAVTYLPDDILTKVDRASMGASLEARVPLLDHRIVALAWRLPVRMKVGGGRSKAILRRVLDRYVPASLIDRPKMGFGVPIGAWLRGPLRTWAEDLLDPGRLREEGFLDPTPIRARWREHLSGRRNNQYLLWDVLMFELWLESGGLARRLSIGGREHGPVKL